MSLSSLLAAVLRFRLLVLGAAAALIVLGVVSLRHMHNDVVPELGAGPVLEVQAEALGLSSQEVEQYVTVPLEHNLLDGVMGVWDVRSHSIPGVSTVDLYFEPGVSTLRARQLVQERLTNAFSLPNVSQPPQLIQPLSSSSRAMLIGLSSPSVNPLELSYLARWIVKPRLVGVPGVANVTIFGQRDRQLQVQVDPARLAAAHVTLNQIIATAGNAQLVSPLSFLEGSSPGTGGFLDGPNQRLEIRPVLPLGAPRDLASVPISGAPGRAQLGSVAKVTVGNQPLIGDALVGSGSGLVLMVQKLPSASILGVTKGVDQALHELGPALGGVKIDTSVFRPASYVSQSFDNLKLAAIIAAGLVLLALLAFFLQVRAAAVAIVSLVLSLLAAAVLLDLLGYTLNALVILGLLVALGVLVDDAVTGASEIVARLRARRHAEQPAPLANVLIEGVGPLRRTLTFASLILLVGVAPAFFAKGISATFVHPMVLAYALAVLASLVIAITITPALAMLAFDRGAVPDRDLSLATTLRPAYEGLVRQTLRVPRSALLALSVVGLVGIVAVPFLREPAPPQFKDRNLVVQWNGPVGASLSEMDRITQRVLHDLRNVPGVADAGATLGRAVTADRIVGVGAGQMFVAIKPHANYGRTESAVKALLASVPGMTARVGTYERDVTSGVFAPAVDELTVRVYGQDYAQLGGLAGRVSSVMSHVHGLGTAHVQAQLQGANLEVRVNDDAARRAGVLPGDARRAASTLVSGLTVGNFFQDQAVFDVVVQGVAPARANLDAVRNLLIDNEGGGHVRLGQIAQVGIRPDPLDIQHQALSRYVDVTAAVRSGNATESRQAIQSKLASVGFPVGYHAELVGGTPDDPTSRAAFLSYVLAAAIGIVLLLQAAFASWRLAALFFLLLPLTLSGGLLVALITGQGTSLGTDAGLLGVFAIAVRQGMLLIGRIRGLQAAERAPLGPEIIVRAASERLCPSLGSILIVAVALIPFVALGDAAGNELGHVAAATMLGGLVSTAALTTLVLPAVCLALGPSRPVPEDEPEPELVSAAASTSSTSEQS
jgi:Cu/Ag efflux pump CusA